LNQDDQLILIKLGFLEVWLAHCASNLVQSEQTLCFPDGSFASRAQLETIYDVSCINSSRNQVSELELSFLCQVDFVNSFVAFSSTFVNAAPSASEMALLCSMILLTPSRNGITDKCLVQSLRDKLVEALKYQVRKKFLCSLFAFP